MLNCLRTRVGCTVLCSLATAGVAAADDDLPPTTDAPAGQYAVLRGLQGPEGMLSARILLDINLSANLAGKPISLAPDLYYSVTDKLQFGLVHQGPLGWQARPGVGICFTGESNGCPHLYDNVGFDLMYGLAFGDFMLSAHSTLSFDSLDPFTTSLALGVAGKVRMGAIAALLFDPKIAIALNERDTHDDALYIPVELGFQVGALTTLKVLSGISGELSHFGDTYEVPVGIGLVRNLTPHFDLGARFSFDNLLGTQPPNVGAGDTRSLAVLLTVRS
jgi:hypothetical protein